MPTLHIFNGDEWSEIVGSGGGGVDSGYQALVMHRSFNVLFGEHAAVNVGIAEYDPLSDYLLVFENKILITEHVEFTLNTGTRAITKIDGMWPGQTRFDFIVFKSITGAATVKMYFNDVTLGTAANEFLINIPEYVPANDLLQVYKNSTYMHPERDYSLSANGLRVVKPSGTWPIGTIFDMVVTKHLRLSPAEYEEKNAQINNLQTSVNGLVTDVGVIQSKVGTIEDNHMVVQDDTTAKKFRIGINNGLLYFQEKLGVN